MQDELRQLLNEIAELQSQRNGKLPYFPLYTEDFYRGTRRFTREERDIYLELLTCQWNAEGRGLPGIEDMAELLAVKREKFKRIWERKLVRKFIELNGRYYNFRVEQVRKSAIVASNRASTRARSKRADTGSEPVSTALDDGAPMF